MEIGKYDLPRLLFLYLFDDTFMQRLRQYCSFFTVYVDVHDNALWYSELFTRRKSLGRLTAPLVTRRRYRSYVALIDVYILIFCCSFNYAILHSVCFCIDESGIQFMLCILSDTGVQGQLPKMETSWMSISSTLLALR